jgi:hypothetical protein
MDRVKIATITLGSYEPPLILDLAHDYYYPENITEWELAEELSNLIEHYERVVYPTYWPPHLRVDKIIAWAEGCQEGTQCNIFCKNYEKGCTLNATK